MKKIKPALFFLAIISILTLYPAGFNLTYGANADLSGFWMITNTYPSPIIAKVETLTQCPNKPAKYSSHDEREGIPPVIVMLITQHSDGTITGGYSAYGISFSITGRVIGDSVNFQSIRAVPSYNITITENYTGIKVSSNSITGSLVGAYREFSESDSSGCLVTTTTNASFTGSFKIDLSRSVPEVDTRISSGPIGATNQHNVSFTWIGFGGEGGIAGYYYQLDSEPPVYTTQTSISFENLDYGPHSFNVAAKDGEGNIDQTPATREFSIEEIEPPNPYDSDYGAPRDPQKTVGDPINSVTGNMYVVAADLSLPGRGLNLEFSRTHNTMSIDRGPLGFGWTHSYNVFLIHNANSDFVKIKDEQGRGLIFTKNSDSSYTAQRGEYSTLVKDSNSFTWTKKDGKKYIFDLIGRLTQIRDRNNNAILLSYDGSQNIFYLTKLIDTAGRQITFTYNAQDRITALTDSSGRSFTYSYDSEDNLIKATDPKGNFTAYEYDEWNFMTKKTDTRGNSVYFTYDDDGRCTSSSSENNHLRVSLAYDPANKKTTLTSSKGEQTIHYYNDDGLITKVVNPQGSQTLSAWDNNLNFISSTDENGQTTLMEYDALGNLSKVTDADSNISVFTYEPNFNLLKSSKDALGNITSYDYDAKGNLTKLTDAKLNETTYTYNEYGQVAGITNPLGNTTHFTYDSQDNLSSIKDALANTTKFSYDPAGRLIQSEDPKVNLSKFAYDELNRLTSVTYADGSSLNYTYDAMGNRLSVSDADSNTTTYGYDQNNRVKSQTDALGNIVSYDYDTEGNLIAVTDQGNNKTVYEYDSLNRLISQTNPLGHKTQYQYDNAGNRASVINPKQQTATYEYDNLNRLKKITYPDAAELTYAYDALGRRTSMTDSFGITNYTYDSLSRLTKVDGPAGTDTIEYTYDAVGNRLTMLDPDGNTTKYTYDALNRLSSITDPQTKITTFSYDTSGNLEIILYPNQTKALYAYDNLNRLTLLTHTKTSSPYEKIAEFGYTYDTIGRRTRINTLEAKVDYTYDSIGQLTQETFASPTDSYQINFDYDSSGNRTRMLKNNTERAYSYNSLNQLLEEDIKGQDLSSINILAQGKVTDPSGIKSVTLNNANASLEANTFTCQIALSKGPNTLTVTALDNAGNSSSKSVNVTYDPSQQIIYTYDDSGNLIKKQSAGQTLNLTYDTDNRLTNLASADTNITYSYDGDGRRISLKQDSTTTNYLYDGLNVILERNGSNTTLASYIRNHTAGGGIGGIIKKHSSISQPIDSYYHYDGLGSTAALTDSTGSTLQSYSYDAFGNTTNQTSSLINPRQFLTKETGLSGFIYFGARYYDPSTGRFITQDPSGMVDGPNMYVYADSVGKPSTLSTNLYAYCDNDPVNFVDPLGLCKEDQSYNQLPPWALVVGGVTIATPIPGDEVAFWASVGIVVVGNYAVHEFSRYNKKGPLWDAPGMPGDRIRQYEQNQPGVYKPPPNFKNWKDKIIWAAGLLAKLFNNFKGGN